MKKGFRVIAVLVLALFVFAGCAKNGVSDGTKPNADSANKETTRVETQQESKADGKAAGLDISKEVKLYGYLIGDGATLKDTPAVMEELNKRLKKDLNCTMEINWITQGEQKTKYPLILASGENVDWVFSAPWAGYQTEAGKGAFMEITKDMFQKNMPLTFTNYKDDTWEVSKVNGKVYMINGTGNSPASTNLIVYNRSLAKKYGVPEPKRVLDLEPYFEAIKKNEPGMIPLNLAKNDAFGRFLIQEYGFNLIQNGSLWLLGFDVLDPEAKMVYALEEPVLPYLKKAVETMKSWYDKGYINKNPFANNVSSMDTFVEGKSGIATCNSINVQTVISKLKDKNVDIGMIPLYKLDGKSQAPQPLTSGIALSATTKNPDRAMRALDLIMNDPEYIELVYFGIKDKNYKVTNDGKIETIDNGGGYPVDASGFWFCNKLIMKPSNTLSDEYIKMNNEIQARAGSTFYYTFVFKQDLVKTEIANCNQVYPQYMQPLMNGIVKDVDEGLKIADEKLKTAGIIKILDELKKQTDQFKASQSK